MEKIVINDTSIEEIGLGDNFSFSRSFSEDDVSVFAKLSGDYNPLHTNDSYAEKTKFGRKIVHGALVASLFSQLLGMYLPGKRCLYLKQTSLFKLPVFIGDELVVLGVVKSKSMTTAILEIETTIKSRGRVVVEGMAVVQVI